VILRNLSYCASKSADGTLQYRRVRGNNNKNKKKRPYITYIFGQTLSYCRFVSVFKLRVCLNCTKCYRNRLRGFNFVWVEFWPFPYKCMSLHSMWTTVHTEMFYRTRLLKWPVVLTQMAQISPSCARMCLFGVRTMTDHIWWGTNPPLKN